MRNLFKNSACFIVVLTIFIACKKEKTTLPDREVKESVMVIAERYDGILKSAAQGWIMSYKPENYTDTIYINLKFSGQYGMAVLAGLRGYHTWDSHLTYGYEGQYRPVIVFEENSVFGYLASMFNGSRKFKINYKENEGYFELTRSDGYEDVVVKLVRASTQNLTLINNEIGRILAQIAYEEEQIRLSEETRLKIKSFAEIQSDRYFYNLKTTGFSAAINQLDTADRKITLTYKETATSAPKSVIVNYTFYPKGIKLTPAISYSNVLIDSIQLGNLNNTVLEIVKAGNTGNGTMGYMNEAPYSYTLTTDRSMTLAKYFVTVFPNYVQSSGVFSPKALIYSENLRNYIENNTGYLTAGRYIYFIYAPTFTTAASSFFVGAQTATGATGNFRYDATFAGLDDNKFVMNQLTRQVLPAGPPNIIHQVSQYLNEVSPAQGVVAVPYDTGAGYRLRLVNSMDSSIWVEYKWPSATYWNLLFN